MLPQPESDKEALDGYEAFVDEYCEFVETYSNTDAEDLVSMMSDYNDMIQKELEWAQKLEVLQ